MRTLGMVFLAGTAAVVGWKLLAALLAGLMGMVLKVALALLILYVFLQVVNGKRETD